MQRVPWLKDLPYLHVPLHPGYIGNNGTQDATDAFWTIAQHAAEKRIFPSTDAIKIYQNFYRVLTHGNHNIAMHPIPGLTRELPNDVEIPTYDPPTFKPLSFAELQALVPVEDQQFIRPTLLQLQPHEVKQEPLDEQPLVEKPLDDEEQITESTLQDLAKPTGPTINKNCQACSKACYICSRGRPCDRCARLGKACVYPERKKEAPGSRSYPKTRAKPKSTKCLECVRMGKPCSKGRPCDRCIKRDVQCVYLGEE
jgi:hypothetical protein